MFKNIKRLLNFFIILTLKRETYYINKKEKLVQSELKVSNKDLLPTYYKCFNKYFPQKKSKFNSDYFYIDQDELFSRFILTRRYMDIFKKIYDGHLITIRTGNHQLMELFCVAAKLSNSYLFSPYKQISDFQFALSFFSKFSLNIISLLRIILFRIFNPKLNATVFRTSNNFFKGQKYDYRISKFIHEADKQKKEICFFIRTRHRFIKIIKHYLQRDRLSIFSDNVDQICYFLSFLKIKIISKINKSHEKKMMISDFYEFLERVIFDKHYIRVDSIQYSSAIFSFIYYLLNTKYAFLDNTSRSIMAFISAKKMNLNTIYFQNGCDFEFNLINYFINNPKTKKLKLFAHDQYHVWNSYWQENLINNGKIYGYSDTFISGYWRDQRHNDDNSDLFKLVKYKKNNQDKVILFLIENETPVKEITPYIEILLENEFKIDFKLRPQQKDAGDNTYDLICKQIKNIDLFKNKTSTIDCTIDEIEKDKYICALGSYTTSLIDCLIMGINVLLINTTTWGDCFNITKDSKAKELFCQKPTDLIIKLVSINEKFSSQQYLYDLLLPINKPTFIENLVQKI